MGEVNTTATVQNTANPQDFFLGAQDAQEQKNIERKQFFREVWQKIQYYWSIIWPYIYRLVSFIVYEVVKVVKGIVHIATSQIRERD